MAKERKSPQEKKQLEYTKDHFTFGWQSSRSFPQTWSRKKARVNRQYRRKSEEVLAEMKPGIAADDVELLADDLTATRFKKSVSCKRLHKVGTVTVGEKIRLKLERRAAGNGRKARWRQSNERAAFESATAAAKTLSSLRGEELISTIRRADLLCTSRTRSALKSVDGKKDPVDRALYFLYRLSYGSAFEVGALRQNPALDKAFGAWIGKARRILEHDTRQRERELAKKQAARAQARS
jgi:hypothetical protein